MPVILATVHTKTNTMSQHNSKKDIQQLVGNTLRVGVWLSFGITVLGLVLFLANHSSLQFEPDALPAEPVKFSLASLKDGLMQGDALALIALGVLILLITPVLRVLFALYGYWMERNRLYVIISAVVLCIIASSLFIGATH